MRRAYTMLGLGTAVFFAASSLTLLPNGTQASSTEQTFMVPATDGYGVADVGVVVNGGSADVEAHVLRVDRDEIVLRPGQCVVEAKLGRHETIPLSGRRPEGGFDLGMRTRRLQPAKCASRK